MKEKRMKIKDLFKDNKDFLENDGYFIYEELDPEAIRSESWCICQHYSDFKHYVEDLLDCILDKLNVIKVTFDEVYVIDFIDNSGNEDTFKFRFRKVDDNVDAWDVVVNDGFPDMR